MRRFSCCVFRRLALAGLLSAGVERGQAAEFCTKGTLRGAYGSLLTGTVINVGPFATVAVVTFDEAGGWAYTESGSFNGNPIPRQTLVGSYSVTAQCSGSATDSAGNTLDFVIVSGGKEVLMVGTNRGAVVTVVLKKIASSDD
jgi:hypothetical protein